MKKYYGTILLISAVIVSAPRWSGAFLFADMAVTEPWINQFLHWGAILSGFLMGPLEVLAAAYLFDNLRKMKPTIIKPATKTLPERIEPNYRYRGTLFFAVGLMILAPIILAPYIVARMSGLTMPEALTSQVMQYIWAISVVIAPIFIVGGVSFVDTNLISIDEKRTKQNTVLLPEPISQSSIVNSNGNKSKQKVTWKSITIPNKWNMFDLPISEIITKYHVSSKTAYQWKSRSKDIREKSNDKA